MKRPIAIAFLLFHLFGVYGNFIAYQYFIYKSDKFFNEQISKNHYRVDDLVEVKLPVKMPAIEDWKEYIFINGQIKLGNASYNYVKLKMTRDTMYLMCIPNYEATRLINQNIINARKIANIPIGKKDHVPLVKTVTINVLKHHVQQFQFSDSYVILQTCTAPFNIRISEPALTNPEQPPEMRGSIS
ncbi:MAG TPA: hypothetical protein VHB54_04330 [Mucilaginibacter sp.]|nr:hypothetical protein [Mucilaginibacter sp.]